MSDDKPTVPPEDKPQAEDAAPDQAAAPDSGEATPKKALSDEEKAD